ncbi:MAG: hypothetical protein IT379_14435 [Deltaproteobacteria bacterium]|nr:hypothetical protein [Deltaproteobacteria bacterium]
MRGAGLVAGVVVCGASMASACGGSDGSEAADATSPPIDARAMGGDGGEPGGDAGPSGADAATDAGPDELPDATASDAGATPSSIREARYLVAVRTPDWDTAQGTLARYRRDVGGAWTRDADDVPIVLGRNGLGWGRGLHGDGAVAGMDGPVKMEGDRRSPAGAFWLDGVYGYASDAPEGTRTPYMAMTPTLQCIEDVDSAYYNRVVDRALVMPDWDSTDLLLRMDGLYELIVFVRHNTDPMPVPGAGSCILLHVASIGTDGAVAPTAGCTSMAFPDLQAIVRAMEPEANLLVQLPDDAYAELTDAWDLPAAGP